MREYELVVLLHPDLEIDIENPLQKVRDIITANGGKITKEDNWGKRKLAYTIAKEDFAVYVFFELELPAQGVKKVQSTFNITDEILRHLLTAVDPKAVAALAAAEEKAKEAELAKNEE